MMQEIAVTLTIAPTMWITIKDTETNLSKRKMWKQWSNGNQKNYLIGLLNRNLSDGMTLKDYTFELHENGNVHLHSLIECKLTYVDLKTLDEMKLDFDVAKFNLRDGVCYDIKRTMSYDNKQETCYIKDVQNRAGWVEYIHKDERCSGCGRYLNKYYGSKNCVFHNLRESPTQELA